MIDPRHPEDQNGTEGMLAIGARYAGIASQFALTLGILGYLGSRADERFGWAPWGILFGILAGMGLGLTAMLRQLEKLDESGKTNKRRK